MEQSYQSNQFGAPEPQPTSQNFFTQAVRYADSWNGEIETIDKRSQKAIKMFMGLEMAQAWPDLMIWETFFNRYPCKTFIEFGTGHGGMALFFALQCLQRKIEFHTFDNVKSFDGTEPLEQLVDLGGKFYHIDIFNEGYDIIVKILDTSPHPITIFFDDGDKPREWRTFGPLTKPGDFLTVHDWGTEFQETDINGLSVVRILGKLSDKRPKDWQAMWFERT